MHYDESYVNPRKRKPTGPKYRAVRKPAGAMPPALRANYRRLVLLEAEEEIRLAEEAQRAGNGKLCAMILQSANHKLAISEGRKYTAPTRTWAQRPQTVDVELRSARRRLQLIQAMQN